MRHKWIIAALVLGAVVLQATPATALRAIGDISPTLDGDWSDTITQESSEETRECVAEGDGSTACQGGDGGDGGDGGSGGSGCDGTTVNTGDGGCQGGDGGDGGSGGAGGAGGSDGSGGDDG